MHNQIVSVFDGAMTDGCNQKQWQAACELAAERIPFKLSQTRQSENSGIYRRLWLPPPGAKDRRQTFAKTQTTQYHFCSGESRKLGTITLQFFIFDSSWSYRVNSIFCVYWESIKNIAWNMAIEDTSYIPWVLTRNDSSGQDLTAVSVIWK